MNKTNNRTGGLSCLAKHGHDFYVRIGKKGAKALWDKYYLYPYGLNKFRFILKSEVNRRMEEAWVK